MGVWDVDGMLRSMSATQFARWVAYAEVDPFGESRADLRAATVASLIANVNRDRKKRSRPYTVNDFMPDFAGTRKKHRAPLTSVADWNEAKKLAAVYTG